MARGGLSHNQRQSQFCAGYRAVRDGHFTSGRVSKTTSSHGGAARKPRATHKPYTPAQYRPTETQYFANTGQWKAGSFEPGNKKVIFGDDFGINE